MNNEVTMGRRLSFGSIVNRSLKASIREAEKHERARQREYARQEKLSNKIDKLNSVCSFTISMPKNDIKFLSLQTNNRISSSEFCEYLRKIGEELLIDTINLIKTGNRVEAISNLIDENQLEYNEIIDVILYIENNLINFLKKYEDTWYEKYGEYEFLDSQEIFQVDEDFDYDSAKAKVTITCLPTDQEEAVSSKDANVLKTKITKAIEKLNKNWILELNKFHEERENKIISTIKESQEQLLKYVTSNGVRAFQFEDLFNNNIFESKIPKIKKPKLELTDIEPILKEINDIKNNEPTLENTNFNFFEKIFIKTPLKNKMEEFRKNRYEKRHIIWSDTLAKIEKQLNDNQGKNEKIKKDYKDNTKLYKEYKEKVAQEKEIFLTKQAEHNKLVQEQIERFKNKEVKEIEEYIKKSLELSPYPILFKKDIIIEYKQESQQINVNYYLPKKNDLYIKDKVKYYSSKQEFTASEIKDNQLKNIYLNIINQIALRTAFEIFTLDGELECINKVNFIGIRPDFDKATGKTIQKEIINLFIDENILNDIDISKVDATSCVESIKNKGYS